MASTSAMLPRSTTTLPFTYSSPNRSSESKITLRSANRDLKRIAAGVPDRSPNDRVAPSEVVICRSPTQINRRRTFSRIRFKAHISSSRKIRVAIRRPRDSRGYVVIMRSCAFTVTLTKIKQRPAFCFISNVEGSIKFYSFNRCNRVPEGNPNKRTERDHRKFLR